MPRKWHKYEGKELECPHILSISSRQSRDTTDNQHWMALEKDRKTGKYIRAILADVKTPGTVREFTLAPDNPFNQINHSIDCAVSPERILSLPGRFYQINHHHSPLVTVFEIRFQGDQVVAKEHPITLPAGTAIREVEFSEDGQQIAWRLRRVYQPPYNTLHPLNMPPSLAMLSTRKKSATARATNSIWISDSQGMNMHEAGYIDVPLRDNDLDPAISEPHWLDSGTDEPGGLQWLPDGKHLCLWIKNEMYFF
jgi:hypothetical protein